MDEGGPLALNSPQTCSVLWFHLAKDSPAAHHFMQDYGQDRSTGHTAARTC